MPRSPIPSRLQNTHPIPSDPNGTTPPAESGGICVISVISLLLTRLARANQFNTRAEVTSGFLYAKVMNMS